MCGIDVQMTIKIFAIALILLTGCSVVSDHQSWEFMQQVGGLLVVGQDKNPNWLIIRGDISGLKEFSNKPTRVNSALALKEVKRGISGTNIQIYVVTTLISDKYNKTEITGVNISGAKKGKYMVQYLNPDNSVVNLKEVEIH